jgi:uncharacterized protein YndB with AHSA1/START domain
MAVLEAAEAVSSSADFVITRTIAAPRNLVWQAWAEPERLALWWGPRSCTVDIEKFDFRPGGIFHFSMKTPDGEKMWARFIYRQILAPERLVFVNSFSNQRAGLARAPFNPAWPLEVLTTLALADRGSETVLSLRAAPIYASEEEMEAFADSAECMERGYGGTFDELEALLAAR